MLKRWDCILETIAERALLNCPENPLPVSAAHGQNYRLYKPGTPDFILNHSLESAILHWIDIKNVNWPADNIFNGNPTLLSFANLIRATTNAVGCSSSMCGNRAAAACVFSQPNVEAGILLYTTGNPCQYDEECVAFSPAYCESALCVNASRPTTMVMTGTTPHEKWTTTPGEEWTTTPEEEWTTVSNDPSTTAAVSTSCSTAFDAAFRKTALEEHNEFRSLVARGLAVNGEFSGMTVPLSSRMNLLEYDCIAEQYALNHVKLCDRQLSSEACRPGYKENIHVYELGSILRNESLILQSVIQNWAGELKDYGIPSDMIFTRRVSEYESNKVDTVTKVIWGTNTKVGCATHKCDDFYFTSCMYEDRVNVVGENIYNIGPTCSECPRASECITLNGLCPSNEEQR